METVQNFVDIVKEKVKDIEVDRSLAVALNLNPLYLLIDLSGNYLPPFQCVMTDQEKDVNRLISRLVGREEAHVAIMELVKWHTEGLDPFHTQLVQVKQWDSLTRHLKFAISREGASQCHSRLAVEKAGKMILVASHAKHQRRDFANEKDVEFFMNGSDGGEETTSDEVFRNRTS
uniref:Uncharacterized protein n=1 Tax=Physcomitrium patens TaxID=3218 RepID=A0A7I4D912_PHYPA